MSVNQLVVVLLIVTLLNSLSITANSGGTQTVYTYAVTNNTGSSTSTVTGVGLIQLLLIVRLQMCVYK